MLLQKTIEKRISFSGIGLHSGKIINVSLEPLDANNGIIFYRKDIGKSIILNPNNIIKTQLSTTIGIKDIFEIQTIEHFLSMLYALGIDNLLIEIDNNEIPIMDGSAYPFLMVFNSAKLKMLREPKKIFKLKKELTIQEEDKYIKLSPNNKINFDITIDFPNTIIGKENFKFDFNTVDFINKISRARTFGFLKEIQYLKQQGLALGGDLTNAIVVDKYNILNENLRYPDEFVRHKLLDLIGDLYTFSNIIIYKVECYKTGHKLNNKAIKTIFNNATEYLEEVEVASNYEKIFNTNLNFSLNFSF